MTLELWVDLSDLPATAFGSAMTHVRSSAATTVLLGPEQLPDWEPIERIAVACCVDDTQFADLDDHEVAVLVARSPACVPAVRARAGGRAVGVRCDIVDAATMDEAAALAGRVDVIVAVFADETNIPLELLLARAQGTRTRVLKGLREHAEAMAVRGVLESGPQGLMVLSGKVSELGVVAQALATQADEQRELVALEVVRSQPAGMGYRGCIDTASLFGQDEGMVVGSTSSGGILVCAEVHYLPYMNLRPFRVNAGAVHSYVFGPNETAYITDLRAGETAYAVSQSGRFRKVLVGRVKVELRPLRLVEAVRGDTRVNLLLQDDWHVRVMAAGGVPMNLTDVRPGDELLGYTCEAGRHVGIKVEECIQEF